jgi:hypothetical protein
LLAYDEFAEAKWFKTHKHLFGKKIVSIYEKNSTTPGGQIANTDLINNAVMRAEDGSYCPDLTNPFVEDCLVLRIY